MTALPQPATGLPLRIYLLSQAKRPGDVRSILIATALKDGWMPLVVNMNLSIFVGMIALTAGFGANESLVFLGIHLTATTVAMSLYLLLQWKQQSGQRLTEPLTEQLLTFNDMLMMLSWSSSLSLFVVAGNEAQSLMLVLLLALAGIASAALNAKTLANLIIGRLALFGPAAGFLIVTQIELWPLLLASVCIGAAVAVGIGYAVHVQLLNEANLVLQMRDTNALLQRTAAQEKAAQESLLQEARFKERFLHSINHDLAQPLSGVDMCLFSLERQDLPATAAKPLATARKCMATARSLIADVSDSAHLKGERPHPQLEPVPLGPVLTDLRDELSPIARHKGRICRVVTSHAVVVADPMMLRRVLRNLAFNAIAHAGEGRILIGVRQRGSVVALTVADTGPGIPPDQQSTVFEAFQRGGKPSQTDTPHLGLGLSIVQSLVSAMSGIVVLDSTPGKGTRFEVILPRVQPKAGTRVWLAEDDDSWRRQMSDWLGLLGMDVTAPWPVSRDATAPLGDYDGVVFDFSLGLDLTALDLIATMPPDMWPKTLVVSEHRDDSVVAELAERGIAFAQKPVSHEAANRWLTRIRKPTV